MSDGASATTTNTLTIDQQNASTNISDNSAAGTAAVSDPALANAASLPPAKETLPKKKRAPRKPVKAVVGGGGGPQGGEQQAAVVASTS